ncbi:MAG: 6-phosphofructokinase [Bacteroidales bacterium]|mgnify:CR=1 FL=1|nr:6-phosphofructokinase [Bacteroidales bacterium]HOY37962.1 6-phosphofructokinase [Bacteroidales bacterium]
MTKFKRIGVLTSGGDAPGMNAAIRAVVRSAIYYGMSVTGIRRGYAGMILGDFMEMTSRDVGNIIQRGGTILRTARSDEFRTKEGRYIAYRNLVEAGIEALIAIGGDGTFKGAKLFTEEYNYPIIGLPGTIDNDLYGTDMTIGYDTAINTAIQAIDKIRDTASSHDRLFFVEVMGRDAGFIALRSAIGCGAEDVLVPEVETNMDEVCANLANSVQKTKNSGVVIVSEGDDAGGAMKIAEIVKQRLPDMDIRVSILGHLQRGGAPSAFDRYLASKLGLAAVEALLDDQRSVMVGLIKNETALIPFNQAIKHHKDINRKMLEMLYILNT